MKNFIKLVINFYGPAFGQSVAAALVRFNYRVGDFLAWLWSDPNYQPLTQKGPYRAKRFLSAVGYYLLAGLVIGLAGLLFSQGRWQLAASLIICFPLIGSHLLAFVIGFGKLVAMLVRPKRLLRLIICLALERQVRRLRRRHNFTVIAVAGSIGKTSTKLAISSLLTGLGLRVRSQLGNYNDRVTVPFVLFGMDPPQLFNPIGWQKAFRQIRRQVGQPKLDFDVVVVELGTDGPGQLADFAYLKPEVGVLTAIAPEHMEFFKTIEAVAAEESCLLGYSQQALVSIDYCNQDYLAEYTYSTYSAQSDSADYVLSVLKDKGFEGKSVQLKLRQAKLKASIKLLGQAGATSALAASAVASLLGQSNQKLAKALLQLEPFAGRLRQFKGKQNSSIIDDSYNASPLAVQQSLDLMYSLPANGRIAILGDMNELGDSSKSAHQEVGDYCDSAKLKLVVTIGPQSKKYLAPAAASRGCQVKSFLNPRLAGEFVLANLNSGDLVLAKGSQNNVFAEEAVKVLLNNKLDQSKLVRQSQQWLNKKQPLLAGPK